MQIIKYIISLVAPFQLNASKLTQRPKNRKFIVGEYRFGSAQKD